MGGWVGGALFQFPFNRHSVGFLAYNVYIAVNATRCRTVWAPNLWGRLLILFIVQSRRRGNRK